MHQCRDRNQGLESGTWTIVGDHPWIGLVLVQPTNAQPDWDLRCDTTEECVRGTSCNDFLFISLQQMQQQCTTGTTCFLMERSAWPHLLRGLMPAPTITMHLQLSWLPLLLLGLCLTWEQRQIQLKLAPW